MTQPKEAGIIQLPLSATLKGAPTKRAPKVAAPRLKLIIRRLPPGLTRAEFETGLGDDWKIGRGKIDWFQFKPGKISKDPAKPSRPARAYVHVLSEEIISSLSEKVRATSFHDARNTSNDPVLLGPPSVEFAPFARVPGSRSRKDGRQGTIDQDPEFVAFLESLTNPITKPIPVEGETEKKEEEEITITPLVQFIKEKKASKAKDSASSKSSKRGAKEKETKAEKVESKKLLKRPDREAAADSTPASPEKKPTAAKVEKATKEAVKAANKQASATKTKQASAKEATQTPDAPASTTERKRERGDARAAAMILQRDLGLSPSGGRRRGKAAAAAATEGDRTKGEEKPESVPSTPTIPTGPKPPRGSSKAAKDTTSKAAAAKAATATTAATSTGPGTSTTTDSAVPATTPRAPKAAKQQKPKQTAVISTATQAFLKHANPSQGVTEELLDAAFSAFGKVTKVEIDKKKGFGYVDFAEAESLQKAIAASPVTVAQSQVVVLERKNTPTQQQAKAAAKPVESAPQASSAAPQQPGGGTQKRSRGPRSRGGRGKGKAAGEGGNAAKTETGGGTSET
ncbi:hypothetical protein TMatcc_009077 [Talaromyces marneffei ATCC 18224]|uniref:Nonsense-mediated mRNA decay protein Upf3, putative n=1 Tax=Talaromyces marneffei (strain ATCC 18224 / CBS 334.59 / QM 7333) TaxID=441960 RepID=B6QNL8_TALMQ|nr:uncharacterized protein EYB26_008370 [Talaromyces marneffei]EEA21506.1 nonsense-mediated mRNA decay protein Upf3, putative [Talaromyces marneffei ATCC 18224]QGA20664.1 hypothetical protein EYB26_008370 [Talaromyces marneffei]